MNFGINKDIVNVELTGLEHGVVVKRSTNSGIRPVTSTTRHKIYKLFRGSKFNLNESLTIWNGNGGNGKTNISVAPEQQRNKHFLVDRHIFLSGSGLRNTNFYNT